MEHERRVISRRFGAGAGGRDGDSRRDHRSHPPEGPRDQPLRPQPLRGRPAYTVRNGSPPYHRQWSGPGRLSISAQADQGASTPTEVPDDHATRQHQHDREGPPSFREPSGRTAARARSGGTERHAARKDVAVVRAHTARELPPFQVPLPRPRSAGRGALHLVQRAGQGGKRRGDLQPGGHRRGPLRGAGHLPAQRRGRLGLGAFAHLQELHHRASVLRGSRLWRRS